MPSAEVRVGITRHHEVELRCTKLIDFLPLPGRQVILHDCPLILGTTSEVIDSVTLAPSIVKVQVKPQDFEKLRQILQHPRSDGNTRTWTYWEEGQPSKSIESAAA